MIASLTTIAGAWLRLLVVRTDNFAFVLLGQLVVACGQPFFFNSMSCLSSAWFGEKEVNHLCFSLSSE